MRYPHVQQHDEKDCGAACLSMVCEKYGLKLPIARYRELIKVDNQGANIYGLVAGAKELGMKADGLVGTVEELLEGISDGEIKLPFVARIINESMFEHYIVVYKVKKDGVIVGDPAKQRVEKLTLEKFEEQWQGQIIVFEPGDTFVVGNERKGSFRKFYKYILTQKKLLWLVFLMSILITFINISGSVVFSYVINTAMSSSAGETCEDEACEEEHHHEEEMLEENGGAVIDVVNKISDKLNLIFINIDVVCIATILLYLLRCLLQLLRGYVLALVSKKVDVPLTLEYFNHLVDLPARFFGTRKTGEFMSRFSDAGKIKEIVSMSTLTVMLDTLMAVAGGVVLYLISGTLFIVTLGVMLIYSVIILVFRKPIKAINREVMESGAQVTSYLKESIDGIETVKAYKSEKMIKNKTEDLYVKLADKSVKGAVIYNLQEVFVQFIASAGVVALLWIGTYLCIEDVIEIGDLFTFYYLIGYFLTPVQNLINLQPELQTAMVAAERLNDILDSNVEVSETNCEPKVLFGDIELKKVNFRYGHRELVLKNVDMLFPKGKRIAIVGESGCGKTTLAKLLIKFYNAESGEITIAGNSIDNYSPDQIRAHVAYVSQEVFLFSDTILNNLKLGNDAISDEEIEAVCKICMLDELIEQLPNGYNTVLDENGSNLSGGQKQRLAIARALLRKPEVLIMDEATSNLDNITEAGIHSVLEAMSGKVTCIIIAHRLNTIKNCDYIYVMNNGQIVESGNHLELLEMDGVYKKYWGILE